MAAVTFTNSELGEAFRNDYAVIHWVDGILWLTVPTKKSFDHIELKEMN